jgi:hypothetical protein
MNCTKCDKEWPETTEYWETRWLERGLAGHACWCKQCTRANDRARYKKPQRWAQQSISNKVKVGHIIDIDPAYIESIWPKDNKCPLLEEELIFGSSKLHSMSPTIDRIIPELGYTKGNVVIVSHLANRIMSNATSKQVQLVGKNMKKIKP